MTKTADEIKAIFSRAGIGETPVRILVYRYLSACHAPVSLGELETALESVDKSTISRTLSTFRNSRLVRSFNDGSGSLKYEICATSDNGMGRFERHIHFRCEECGTTTCLNDLKVPEVALPHGYKVNEVNYLVTGFCPECSKKLAL